MSVYDEVLYHGTRCVVEQTFEIDNEPYCALRPCGRPTEYSGECAGTYFVAQSYTEPIGR